VAWELQRPFTALGQPNKGPPQPGRLHSGLLEPPLIDGVSICLPVCPEGPEPRRGPPRPNLNLGGVLHFLSYAAVPRNLQQPLQRQKPLQTILDREPTLGHRKKLPARKSEPAPTPVGPSAPNILTAEEGPGREGKSQPGPKRSRGLGDVGNAASHYKRRAIFVLPIAKGRRTAILRRFSASSPRPRDQQY
jgi:hypothetical protein